MPSNLSPMRTARQQTARAEAFGDLAAHPAWKMLVEHLDKECQGHKRCIFEMRYSVPDADTISVAKASASITTIRNMIQWVYREGDSSVPVDIERMFV